MGPDIESPHASSPASAAAGDETGKDCLFQGMATVDTLVGSFPDLPVSPDSRRLAQADTALPESQCWSYCLVAVILGILPLLVLLYVLMKRKSAASAARRPASRKFVQKRAPT